MEKEYETYKDSGIEWIGRIPMQWDSIKLKFLGYLFSGLSGKKGDDFKRDDSEFNKNYIPFTNIANNSVIDPNRLDSVEIFENENQNDVKKNDLFFLMSSENYEDIGKTAVLKIELENTYLNSFCKGFRLNNQDEVDASFLNYLLAGDIYRKILSIEAKGFTRINLQMGKIQNLPVIMPQNKSEQTQIASYLDYKTNKIDALISKKETIIQKLQEQRRAIINEAVTKGLNKNVALKDSGIEWLGKIPENWPIAKFKYFAKIRNGKDQKSVLVDDGKYPILGTGGEFGRASEFLYDKPSVLLGRKGTIDKPQFIEEPFWTVDTLFYTKIESDVVPKFLFYLSTLIPFSLLQESSAVPSMTQDKLHNVFLTKPSYDEQLRIVAFLESELDKLNVLNQLNLKQIQKLKDYRQSLISEAVTGKIDVRDWQQPNN